MQETIQFLKEYTEFFEEIERKEAEKLGMILSKELKKVESAILLEESMNKQTQNMEEKRLRYFADHGLEGKSFKDLVESSRGEDRGILQELQIRLDGAIGNIRFYNDKASDLARQELVRIGMSPGEQDNPAGIYGPSTPRKGLRLEKKA